jgi:hypothetical protein
MWASSIVNLMSLKLRAPMKTRQERSETTNGAHPFLDILPTPLDEGFVTGSDYRSGAALLGKLCISLIASPL